MNQYSDNRRSYANKIESNIVTIKSINDTINKKYIKQGEVIE